MHALALSSDVLNSFSLVKVLCADTENRTLARIDTTNHGVSASSKRAVRLLSSECLGSSEAIQPSSLLRLIAFRRLDTA
jgi:hypothetical protein